MCFHIKIWHLVELFLIFWHCFLFVYLQIKKAGNFKFYYQNWFIFWKISLKKHNNKQILLYILYRNTIWPSGTIARVFVSRENHSMCFTNTHFCSTWTLFTRNVGFGKCWGVKSRKSGFLRIEYPVCDIPIVCTWGI